MKKNTVQSQIFSPSYSRAEGGEIQGKKLLMQTVFTIVILVGLLAFASRYFKGYLEAWSRSFISITGELGVALGFFLPDAFTVPIPPDTFLVAGHLGGLPFWTITLWASLGSILGGSLGFFLVRTLATKPKIRRWLDLKMSNSKGFIERYGLLALGLGALTPLPYSIMCWACGAMGTRWVPFLLVSLLRIPRIGVYLLIIEQTMTQMG